MLSCNNPKCLYIYKEVSKLILLLNRPIDIFMKNLIISISVFIFLFLLVSSSSWSQQKISIRSNPSHNCVLTNISVDTTQFSIRVSGSSNCVVVNGKSLTSTNDSIKTNNKISVSGDGNRVSIIQSDGKSDVNIKQEGAHNQVIISQRK